MPIKRQDLWERQGGRCYYCGQQMIYVQNPRERTRLVHSKNPLVATLDHVIPRSALPEGYDLPHNLVYACLRCNYQKGASIPKGWNRRLPNWVWTGRGWAWAGGPGTLAALYEETEVLGQPSAPRSVAGPPYTEEGTHEPTSS